MWKNKKMLLDSNIFLFCNTSSPYASKGVLLKTTELQAKFHKYLVIRGYTESTIQSYLPIADEFEKFVGLTPELFEEKHAVNFLYDCITNRKLKEDTVNFKNSIIKLLFVVTLNKEC